MTFAHQCQWYTWRHKVARQLGDTGCHLSRSHAFDVGLLHSCETESEYLDRSAWAAYRQR